MKRYLLIGFLALQLLAAKAALAGPYTLPVGSMLDWSNYTTGVSGTNGVQFYDKQFKWLGDSGNWGDFAQMYLSVQPVADTHAMNLIFLNDYQGPITLSLEYEVDIIGPKVFENVALDQTHTENNTQTWKDVYSSLADMEANTAPGSGTLAALHAVNALVDPHDALLPGVKKIWVRDTIELTDATGQMQSLANTYGQREVPEIDPSSFGSALALVMGALGVVERRTRKALGLPMAA